MRGALPPAVEAAGAALWRRVAARRDASRGAAAAALETLDGARRRQIHAGVAACADGGGGSVGGGAAAGARADVTSGQSAATATSRPSSYEHALESVRASMRVRSDLEKAVAPAAPPVDATKTAERAEQPQWLLVSNVPLSASRDDLYRLFAAAKLAANDCFRAPVSGRPLDCQWLVRLPNKAAAEEAALAANRRYVGFRVVSVQPVRTPAVERALSKLRLNASDVGHSLIVRYTDRGEGNVRRHQLAALLEEFTPLRIQTLSPSAARLVFADEASVRRAARELQRAYLGADMVDVQYV